jgi:hypothetical protein
MTRSDDRILLTLDLDFANIRAYPPGEHAGIIVLRPKRQDKLTVLTYFRRLTKALANSNPTGELWTVDGIPGTASAASNRIRFRQGS